MRASLVVLVFALMAIVAPIALYVYQRQVQEQDVEGISRLRNDLDSTRGALAAARTAADSARLVDDIRAREYWLGRREFHVPGRQEQLAGWWRPTAPATLSVALGAVLLVGGLAWRRRTNKAQPNP